ncbi:MAG TPA: F0F1 ATP synthase subunit epsilon [Pseudonocardiaceae bacterium]|nr:F0F1 ATP synthase subunit epsilon [Pseudonocardiaceae bacterium]
MAEMSVELVAVERKVWSGNATWVFAETTEGELGILPGHTPLLGELVEGGIVKVTTTDDETVTAAVFGGFLSVTGEKVSVLAESAELAEEIDPQAARDALAQADTGKDRDGADSARARATARLKAVGQAV